VSSELQAVKASPGEQERSCREHAKAKGYAVVEVYRDIERYRLKGRMVEPSGTRSDRPGLVKMLAAGEAGFFDVIVAWREDRLYRGLRPMLAVLDLVERGCFTIDLVTETFDPRMAPIKASIAKMELEAFRERRSLGMKARLAAGRSWVGYYRYGYARDGDNVIVHPIEAPWVRQIFEWFVSGVGVRDIARHLVAANAPQKEGRQQRLRWPLTFIYRILKCEVYASGIHRVQHDGETFELPVPVLISAAQWRKAQEIIAAHRANPVHHVRYHYLLTGIVTCPCGAKWHGYTRTREDTRVKKSTGERRTHLSTLGIYRCARLTATSNGERNADCPGTKGAVRLDELVWQRVEAILRNPNALVVAATARMEELRAKHSEAASRERALLSRLDKVELQRQAYVRKFGADSTSGGPFTEQDLDAALQGLSLEGLEVKRELAEVALLADTRFGDLEDLVERHLADIRAGTDWLSQEPTSEGEVREQFEDRVQIVHALVDRVVLRRSREPEIILRLDLAPLLNIESRASPGRLSSSSSGRAPPR
jgi:DNA invertase Pin-like site-specific DNA recombinase